MDNNSFGGAHIDNNGLHLGHFYGSILPLLKKTTNLITVILWSEIGTILIRIKTLQLLLHKFTP